MDFISFELDTKLDTSLKIIFVQKFQNFQSYRKKNIFNLRMRLCFNLSDFEGKKLFKMILTLTIVTKSLTLLTLNPKILNFYEWSILFHADEF